MHAPPIHHTSYIIHHTSYIIQTVSIGHSGAEEISHHIDCGQTQGYLGYAIHSTYEWMYDDYTYVFLCAYACVYVCVCVCVCVCVSLCVCVCVYTGQDLSHCWHKPRTHGTANYVSGRESHCCNVTGSSSAQCV